MLSIVSVLFLASAQGNGLAHPNNTTFIPLHDMHVQTPALGSTKINGKFYLGGRTKSSLSVKPRVFMVASNAIFFDPTLAWEESPSVKFDPPVQMSDTKPTGPVLEGSVIGFHANMPAGVSASDNIWIAVTLLGKNHKNQEETSIVANLAPSLSSSSRIIAYLKARVAHEKKQERNPDNKRPGRGASNFSKLLQRAILNRERHLGPFVGSLTDTIIPISFVRPVGEIAPPPKYNHLFWLNNPSDWHPNLYYTREASQPPFGILWRDLLKDDSTAGAEHAHTDNHNAFYDLDRVTHLMVVDEASSDSALGPVYEWSGVIRPTS